MKPKIRFKDGYWICTYKHVALPNPVEFSWINLITALGQLHCLYLTNQVDYTPSEKVEILSSKKDESEFVH